MHRITVKALVGYKANDSLPKPSSLRLAASTRFIDNAIDREFSTIDTQRKEVGAYGLTSR